jgi:hypothetical protein
MTLFQSLSDREPLPMQEQPDLTTDADVTEFNAKVSTAPHLLFGSEGDGSSGGSARGTSDSSMSWRGLGSFLRSEMVLDFTKKTLKFILPLRESLRMAGMDPVRSTVPGVLERKFLAPAKHTTH